MITFTFLLLVIIHALYGAAPAAAQERLTVEIVKFSCRQLPSDVMSKNIPEEDVDAVTSQRYRNNQNTPSNEVNMSKIESEKYERAQQKSAEGASRPKDYEYKLEIKNNGTKEIVSLKWTYVFTDPVTQKQLVQHSFDSRVSIKPGKQKRIVLYTDQSLPHVVNAQAQTATGSPWKESVVIQRVQYADGTAWERPGQSDADGNN